MGTIALTRRQMIWRRMYSKSDFLVLAKWLSAWTLTTFAGLSVPLQTLWWFILIDSISGVLATIKQNRGLSSAAGAFGIFKKLAMVLMLWMVNRGEAAVGHNYGFMNLLAVLFIVNEGISIMENCSRLSPEAVPPGLLNSLYILKKAQKLTIIARVNKAMAVFMGVEPDEVERGKDVGNTGKPDDGTL